MSPYLSQNKNTYLSRTTFSVRSGTLDIKVWNEWNYENKLCVMCSMSEESFEHSMSCKTYGKVSCEIGWKEIFLNNVENQILVAKEVKRRQYLRKKRIEEVGLPPIMAPLLQ